MSDAIRKFLDHAAQQIGQPYSWADPTFGAQPLIDFHRSVFGDARMDGDDGGGGGGATGATGPAGPGGATGATGSTGSTGATYTPPSTQAELDRIISDRLTRERAKYGDYDTLKAAADELQKIKDGQKSEVERLTAERDRATKDAEAAKERAKATARSAAVVTEAAKSGAIDPHDIVALLPADAVTVADDGTVSGAADAVKALLDAKPHLKGTGRPSGPPNHGQGSRANGNPERGAAGRAEAQKRFGGDKAKT